MHAAARRCDDLLPADIEVCLRFNVAEGYFSGGRQGNIPLSRGNTVQVDPDTVLSGDQADFSGIHAAQRFRIDSKLRLGSLASNGLYRAILKADLVRPLGQGKRFCVNFSIQFGCPADNINILRTVSVKAVAADNH